MTGRIKDGYQAHYCGEPMPVDTVEDCLKLIDALQEKIGALQRHLEQAQAERDEFLISPTHVEGVPIMPVACLVGGLAVAAMLLLF